MLLAGKARDANEANIIAKALTPGENDLPEEERTKYR